MQVEETFLLGDTYPWTYNKLLINAFVDTDSAVLLYKDQLRQTHFQPFFYIPGGILGNEAGVQAGTVLSTLALSCIMAYDGVAVIRLWVPFFNTLFFPFHSHQTGWTALVSRLLEKLAKNR